MEGTVTLEIQEYNELYVKAVQGQMLERENSELREKLNGTTNVIHEMVDVIDFEMINKEIEKLKEMNESLKMRLNDEKRLYEYKVKNEEEKCIGTIENESEVLELRKILFEITEEMKDLKKEVRRINKEDN